MAQERKWHRSPVVQAAIVTGVFALIGSVVAAWIDKSPRQEVNPDKLINEEILQSQNAGFLAKYLDHENVKVAEAAAYRLVELHGQAMPALAALEKATKDPRGQIAKYAKTAVRKLKAQ